ncbi:hypothetical protein HNQ55_003327 [Thalassotalea piscium]|uniref:Uncharacterized protein n=1 Tax=Thalassotalea piscium TaxID=1230533 RepID=A0A7X0NJV6_9GAMM|nr:hypothetical protein [Thalassotalea piscium]
MPFVKALTQLPTQDPCISLLISVLSLTILPLLNSTTLVSPTGSQSQVNSSIS